MNKSHDKNADALRGIAIILVIFLHITANPSFFYIKSHLEFINYIFQNIRIPLFTILSGYFFSYLRLEKKETLVILKNKGRRILLPMYCVLTIDILYLYLFKDSSASELLPRFIFSYDHYWFVQAIITIFTFHSLIIKRYSNVFILFLFSSTFYILGNKLNINTAFFSLGGALYLYPYFLTGIIANKFNIEQRKHFFRIILLIGCLILAAQFFSYQTQYAELFNKRTILGLLTGICICSYLLSLNLKSALLTVIGKYSFSIYIMQAFGIKIGTVLCNILVPENNWLQVLFISFITILFGIASALTAQKASNFLVCSREALLRRYA